MSSLYYQIGLQLTVGYNITMQEDQYDLLFPSFAASPQQSPGKYLHMNSNQQRSVTKITIELPQSLVESTLDENSQYHNDSKADDGQNIRVFCRFRPARHPFNFKHDYTMIDDGENRYSFDAIFDRNTSQVNVYSAVAGRHIDAFFRGENSTIFTYGQTGSGKTFTMFGDLKEKTGYGIIPRGLEQIFKKKKTSEEITCSILQIYNQKLIDLFDPLKQSLEGIKIKQMADSVTLQGLVEVKVENHHQVMDLIRFGYRDRKIATTQNNDCSSRSHTILFVYRSYHCEDRIYKNKICFIDLAGSEKIRKSGVTGQNLQEAKKINLSLSCLGNVISALTSSAEHIPYRNSKLTRILKDSLNGYSKTSIITTCSSQKNDSGESLSTIRFAVRAKRIKNKKRLQNVQVSPQEIIETLKKELAVTKKELQYYKLKQKVEQQCDPQEIPEQAVVSRPIRGSQFTGVNSRITKFSMSHSIQE